MRNDGDTRALVKCGEKEKSAWSLGVRGGSDQFVRKSSLWKPAWSINPSLWRWIRSWEAQVCRDVWRDMWSDESSSAIFLTSGKVFVWGTLRGVLTLGTGASCRAWAQLFPLHNPPLTCAHTAPNDSGPSRFQFLSRSQFLWFVDFLCHAHAPFSAF